MIARLWSARTTPALSSSYLNHFEQAVQPQLLELNGFLGATVFTRSLDKSGRVIPSLPAQPGGARNLSSAAPSPALIEILVTTYWASFAAIDAFAGADRDSAVVADAAAALLTDFDRHVRHFDVALANLPSA